MKKILVFASRKLWHFLILYKRPSFLFFMKANLICGALLVVAVNLLASNRSSLGENIHEAIVELKIRSETAPLKAALKTLEEERSADKNSNLPRLRGDEQQQRKISGIVLDENGLALPGVSISMKDTRNLRGDIPTSTASDNNGHWSLYNVTDTTVLVITSIGYEKQEIKVGNRTSLQIVLKPDKATEMQEVVVTGLYQRPQQNFTGAATTITKEQLSNVTNGNVLNALSVLDPSFQITENLNAGSNPNALADVQIRGGNSIVNPGSGNSNDVFEYTSSSVNTPLFLLDGFEVTLQRISDLDINRIASVTILKDAAATSIYGSRAANGVVVVETVKPVPGKLRVSYNSTFTIEAPDLRSYDVLNAKEKLDLEVQSGLYRQSSGINETIEKLNILYSSRKALVEQGIDTYWLSQPLQTSLGLKQNVYIEGGDERILYGVGLTYDKRIGVMKGSDRMTPQGNIYLQYKNKKLTVRNDFNISFNEANNSPYGTFDTYVKQNPYYTPYNEDGSIKYYLEDIYLSNGQISSSGEHYSRVTNPMYNSGLAVVDQTRYLSLIDNIDLMYQASSWLGLNGRLSVQKQLNYADKFLPPDHTDFASLAADEFYKKGSYTYSRGDMLSLDGNFTADLNKSWGKHMFYSTLGANFKTTESTTETVVATGFPNERLQNFYNAIQYAENTKPTGYESTTRLIGFLGNLSYAYDNRYLADFSYRKDGSSLYGANNRFANFWSVGGGWNIHKEHFWTNNDLINLLKLRYSFGYTGSQNFASYLSNTTAEYYNDRNYNNSIGLTLLGFGNENLSWQETQKQNLGLDMTLFNNRIDIRANYFIEKTKNALATVNTAPSTGFSSYQENLGDLNNKGWEAYVNFRLYNKGRDNVSVFANIFSSKGEYVKISNSLKALNQMADTSTSTVPLIRYQEGESPTAIWAVQSKGIDPSNGQEIFLTKDGTLTNTYSTLDQVIVGDTRADLEGTFGTNAEYRGIGLNAYFRFRIGGQIYNQTLADRVENADIQYNVDRRVYEERWIKPGDHTFFKGLVDSEGYTISTSPTYPTSRFVQDYNYLTLENLSIYYRFSDVINKKLGLSSSRINLYTTQVFRVSTVKQERGLDYPFSRTVSLMLQASF